MTYANLIYWVVIAVILVEAAWTFILSSLDAKASKNPIPNILGDVYDGESYRKQQEYFAAKTRFGRYSAGTSSLIELVLFGCGIYGLTAGMVQGVTDSLVLQTVLFVIVFSAVESIIELPFDWYSTFVLEEKFGFNRTTKKTFFGDAVKNVLLSLIMSGILYAGMAAIYEAIPDWFWIAAFTVMLLFTVILSYLFSDIIVPLFNKQTPLEEGELRDKILSFADKAGFKLKNVYVIDGSKRSTHSNAYFTGFGKRKRIVLYDTLIERLTTEEIVAVLAHEVGHYKKHHIIKGMLSGAISSLVSMYIMGLILSSDAVAQAAGASSAVFYINMYVFTMLWAPLNHMLDIISNSISRRNEFEADAFACSYGLGEYLASALKKLASENLSNLTPHPFVVKVSHSHPTLLERVTRC